MIYNNIIDLLFLNNNHCIIHGLAGTGKSNLIHEIANRKGERCLKLAPTGLAAYNINGATVDSLLNCYLRAQNSTLDKLEMSYDCIIVDEISMVHYYKMDRIFQIIEKLQNYGKNLKLILIGDPFQLPPVTPQNMIQVFSEKKNTALTQQDFYFFHSKYFQNHFNSMNCFLLEKNYRQNDPLFESFLRKIATGTADGCDLDLINQRIVNPSNFSDIQNVPIVIPTRNGVRFFNSRGLDQLGEKYVHTAVFERLAPGYEEIEMDCRDITDPIIYADNAPIIFTQNDYFKSLVNGSKGTICGRDGYNAEIIRIRMGNNNEVQCQPTRHSLFRFVYNRNTRLIDNECVAVVRQYPFILGFALTVHKCQGMTLEKMTFNPGEGCFAPGQLYVALSRVKSLNDLTLHVPMRLDDIIISSDVNTYFESFRQRCHIVQ
jgi:ATP-dependent exoDNAse (exonuclease V) alpha subunit